MDRYTAKANFDRLVDGGRSGNAANRDRKNLASAWAWGAANLRDWPIGENPFLAVSRYRAEEEARYVPGEADFWKVTDYLNEKAESGTPEAVQDYTMHMAFLHLAARRGEIFRMRVADLDMAGGLVKLWTRKRAGGKLEGDVLPVTAELKSLLVRWLEIRMGLGIRSDHVFVSVGNPIGHYGMPFKSRQHFMARLCERAVVPAFGFHAIRHFTASYLFRQGQPVGVVQRVLRHKSPNVTERYLRSLGFETGVIREALEEISKTKAVVIPLRKESGK